MEVAALRTGWEWGNVSPFPSAHPPPATRNTHTHTHEQVPMDMQLKDIPQPLLPTIAGPPS